MAELLRGRRLFRPQHEGVSSAVPVDAALVSMDAVCMLESGHRLPDLRVETAVDGAAVIDVRDLEQTYLQLVNTVTGVALAQ